MDFASQACRTAEHAVRMQLAAHPLALKAAEATEAQEGGTSSHLRAAPEFLVNGKVFDVSAGMQALVDTVVAAGIAVVGSEGVVGVPLFMGGGSKSSRALIQSAGGAFRLSARVMKLEFDEGGPVLHLLLRYTQALMVTADRATEAAMKLKQLGVISFDDGLIQVLDRPALEKRSCECYAVVKREYDRLLPVRSAA